MASFWWTPESPISFPEISWGSRLLPGGGPNERWSRLRVEGAHRGLVLNLSTTSEGTPGWRRVDNSWIARRMGAFFIPEHHPLMIEFRSISRRFRTTHLGLAEVTKETSLPPLPVAGSYLHPALALHVCLFALDFAREIIPLHSILIPVFCLALSDSFTHCLHFQICFQLLLIFTWIESSTDRSCFVTSNWRSSASYYMVSPHLFFLDNVHKQSLAQRTPRKPNNTGRSKNQYQHKSNSRRVIVRDLSDKWYSLKKVLPCFITEALRYFHRTW